MIHGAHGQDPTWQEVVGTTLTDIDPVVAKQVILSNPAFRAGQFLAAMSRVAGWQDHTQRGGHMDKFHERTAAALQRKVEPGGVCVCLCLCVPQVSGGCRCVRVCLRLCVCCASGCACASGCVCLWVPRACRVCHAFASLQHTTLAGAGHRHVQ